MQTVASGGDATGTTVSSGGSQIVQSGGSASGTVISAGGSETVSGSASSTTISSGGCRLSPRAATRRGRRSPMAAARSCNPAAALAAR
jgi:autotransporter passenger strand-loop-strand repeat protein